MSALPTSFEGTYGSVRYWLDAVVERPWRIDLNTRTPLVIVERVQTRNPEFLVSTGSKCIPGPEGTRLDVVRGGSHHNLSLRIENKPKLESLTFSCPLVHEALYNGLSLVLNMMYDHIPDSFFAL